MDATEFHDEAGTPLEQQFGEALLQYGRRTDEAALGRAYELGRTGLAQGRSIPDIVAAHGQALREIIARQGGGAAIDRMLQRGAALLAEALSSYEMTHRGYREAVSASRQLNETLEQEAKRIAHALHDEAGQLLVSVHLALAELERDLDPGMQAGFHKVQALLDQIEHQLRHLSHELRPTLLDDLGWLPAIQFLADGVSQRAHMPVEVHSSTTARLPPAAETALYRTVQEALTNAARHSHASCVRIEVQDDCGTLRCLIGDDGVGFDPAASGSGGGLGLRGMRERLNAVGGKLQIDSGPGAGTQITLYLPMED